MGPLPLPDPGETESQLPVLAGVLAFHENGAASELSVTVCVSVPLWPVNSTPPGEAESVPDGAAPPRSSTTGTASVFRAPELCTRIYPT